MEKTELRKDTIKKLKNIPDAERKQIEDGLKYHLVESDLWKQSDIIGITISNGFEWNTKPIIETAWQEGKTVCVPKCLPKQRKMEFYQINTYDQLEVVYYQLLEPIPEETVKMEKNMIDLLVVPGLLFDKNGYRIGFGGGYYDRFLEDYRNKTVSIASASQIVEELPAESYDLPIERIITENGILR
nr:5-formyltetrahydrofolate cyclo-ligase [Virgibacillus doumboii]